MIRLNKQMWTNSRLWAFMTSRAVIAWMILLLFATLFLVLRSNQFTAVDGALRCLDVYHHPHLSFHGNNHLLYPVNILVWSKLAGVGGISPETPGEYMRLSQSMNCWSAAATLAFLWLLISGILIDRLLSLLLVIVYGFSKAFMLHATNSAEPVVGLMYAIAALFTLRTALTRDKVLLAGLSGVFLGLAFATYQAMFLAVFGGIWICLFDPDAKFVSVRRRSAVLSVFLLSCAVATTVVYGWAYATQGVVLGWPIVRQFFRIGGGSEIYAGFSISRVVNFPIGFLSNLAPVIPRDYAGLRSLFARSNNIAWFAALAAMGSLVFIPLIALFIGGFRRWGDCSHPRRWMALLGAGSILPAVWPLLYWDPMYDKLWLLPFALAAIGLAYVGRFAPWSKSAQRTTTLLLIALALVEVPTNLYRAIGDSHSPTTGLKEALNVGSFLTPNDSIVLDFDEVSSLYLAYSGNENAVLLPSMHLKDAQLALAVQLERCRESHGKLFFLGILDQTEATWKMFMQARMGIPYSTLDQYRSDSRTVETFQVNGRPITLRMYQP